jgi:hypothetical protein
MKFRGLIASNSSYRDKQVYLASTILCLEEDHADILYKALDDHDGYSEHDWKLISI